MKYTWFHSLLVLLMLPALASAQTPGTCPRSEGEAYLDVGNVRARILNNGALFYRGEPHVYEVPKGSGSNALFATVIWIGGLIDDSLRTAATRYGEWEFWAGPLNKRGNPPADCDPYDRLWEITRADLVAYAETGVPTANLLEWPWKLGAPVIDGDGVAGNYNLAGGDLPALRGDQMLWWVMNDRGNLHESTDTPPIGIEVHGSAFAFQQPRSPIGNVTFYRYVLHYKGEHPFTMQPGDTQEVLFAIVWSRGNNNLDSVRQLKKEVKYLHHVADAILPPNVAVSLPEPPPEPAPVLGFAQNYPNPFRESTTIRYSLPQARRVRLVVYDVLGREVVVLVDGQQDGGVYAVDFDARRVAPGVYVVHFQVDALHFTKTMTVIR